MAIRLYRYEPLNLSIWTKFQRPRDPTNFLTLLDFIRCLGDFESWHLVLKFLKFRDSPKLPKGYDAEMCHFSIGNCSVTFAQFCFRYTPEFVQLFCGYPWKWLGSDEISWKWGGPFWGGDPLIFGGGIPSLADQIVDENFDQLNVGRAQMISLAFWGVWAWGQHLVFSKVHVAFFFALDHEHVWVWDDHRSSVCFFDLHDLGGISIEMCRQNPQNHILAVIKRPMVIHVSILFDWWIDRRGICTCIFGLVNL